MKIIENIKYYINIKKQLKKDKIKLYRCDPDKNKHCTKTNCYRYYPLCCKYTIDKKYRMTNIFKRLKEDLYLWLYIRHSKKISKR